MEEYVQGTLRSMGYLIQPDKPQVVGQSGAIVGLDPHRPRLQCSILKFYMLLDATVLV